MSLCSSSNLPLKGMDKNGRRVILLRASVSDPSKHSLNDQMRASLMVMEMLMEKADQASITGLVLIQDASDQTMAHATQFSPSFAKKAMTVWQVNTFLWKKTLPRNSFLAVDLSL